MVYQRKVFFAMANYSSSSSQLLKKSSKKDFLSQNCLSSQNLCVEVAKVWGKSLGRRFQAKASAAEAEG